MPVPTRAHEGNGPAARSRSRVTWVVLAVVVAAISVIPSIVGASVTVEPAGSTWLTRPWLGWQFAGTVLLEAPDAQAAAPGEALELATAAFDEPAATSVELAYLRGDEGITFPALTETGERDVTVDPPRPLVWHVYGTWSSDGARGTIGLLDFATGTLVWDVRDDAPDPRTDST